LVDKSEKLILKDLHKVVSVVVEQAKEGDLVAAKMVWETFFKKAANIDDVQKGTGGITINVTSTEQKNITIEHDSENIEDA
tara:strand:- start:5 stop:247 length:243 start_codon:yes stop_codon:yes gene_type:complete